MTIVTSGSEEIIDQIYKQLNKLVDIVTLADISDGNHIERELMMVKLSTPGDRERAELKRMADIFRGRILDVTDETYIIELTGNGTKLDAFLSAIDPKLILETVRSGATGISRGSRALRI